MTLKDTEHERSSFPYLNWINKVAETERTHTLNNQNGCISQWDALITCSNVLSLKCSSEIKSNVGRREKTNSQINNLNLKRWKSNEMHASANKTDQPTDSWQLKSFSRFAIAPLDSLCAYNFTSLILTILFSLHCLSFGYTCGSHFSERDFKDCSVWHFMMPFPLHFMLVAYLRNNVWQIFIQYTTVSVS